MSSPTQTFLFADLVGFTALAELEGDERALEVVLELQRRVRDLLREHRTEQVKAIGDGLMLRSSTPQDAIRLAVRLAQELADKRASRRYASVSTAAPRSAAMATGTERQSTSPHAFARSHPAAR